MTNKYTLTTGLHCSHPTYWKEGDTLIAVRVKIEDIITCQAGKVRCRKLTVIGKVDGGAT